MLNTCLCGLVYYRPVSKKRKKMMRRIKGVFVVSSEMADTESGSRLQEEEEEEEEERCVVFIDGQMVLGDDSDEERVSWEYDNEGFAIMHCQNYNNTCKLVQVDKCMLYRQFVIGNKSSKNICKLNECEPTPDLNTSTKQNQEQMCSLNTSQLLNPLSLQTCKLNECEPTPCLNTKQNQEQMCSLNSSQLLSPFSLQTCKLNECESTPCLNTKQNQEQMCSLNTSQFLNPLSLQTCKLNECEPTPCLKTKQNQEQMCSLNTSQFLNPLSLQICKLNECEPTPCLKTKQNQEQMCSLNTNLVLNHVSLHTGKDMVNDDTERQLEPIPSDESIDNDKDIEPIKNQINTMEERTENLDTIKQSANLNTIEKGVETLSKPITEKTGKPSGVSILRNGTFILFILGMAFFYSAASVTNMFVPALAQERGIEHSDLSLVLTIAGIAESLAVIPMGFLLDSSIAVPNRRYFQSCFLIFYGICVSILSETKDLAGFAAMRGIQAIVKETIGSQTAAVLVDLFGFHNLTRGYGFTTGFMGVAGLSWIFLSGNSKYLLVITFAMNNSKFCDLWDI